MVATPRIHEYTTKARKRKFRDDDSSLAVGSIPFASFPLLSLAFLSFSLIFSFLFLSFPLIFSIQFWFLSPFIQLLL